MFGVKIRDFRPKNCLSIVIRSDNEQTRTDLIGSPKYWEATPTVAPSIHIAQEAL